MAYGDKTGKGYAAGTATDSLAARDLNFPLVGGLRPMVQQITHPVTGVQSYTRTVPTPGTAVRLNNGTPQLCLQVMILALESNTDAVAVGGSSALATTGSQNGILLYKRESITFEIDDANNIFVDARVTGEGVTYIVMT